MVSIDWCINQVLIKRRLDLNLFALYFRWTNQQSSLHLKRAGLASRNHTTNKFKSTLRCSGTCFIFTHSLVYAEQVNTYPFHSRLPRYICACAASCITLNYSARAIHRIGMHFFVDCETIAQVNSTCQSFLIGKLNQYSSFFMVSN